MKNTIISILAVTTLVVGYIAATSKLRLNLQGLEGKTTKITRGDLTLPINATGEVKPGYRVEIKAEASGEVIQIARHAGDLVRAGDLLIRLQPDDEQRNVNRAQRDLDLAEAKLAETRLRLKQSQTADLAAVQARVDQLIEQVRLAKYRQDKLAALPPDQRNEEETLQRETTYRSQVAQLHAAEAELEKARIAIPRTEQIVNQALATFETAKNNLGDAEKRLRETDIIAPIDGVVAIIHTQIGEVIQGGKTTLTGGTVLAVILDMSKMIVRAEVDESDIGRVLDLAPPWARPGHDSRVQVPGDMVAAAQSMEHIPVITVESFRDTEFIGVIERIYPEPKTMTGVVTYMVDVVIVSDNRSMLLPGMRADVEFTSEHVQNVLLCPNEAIREGPGGKLGAYVPKPNTPATERATEFRACKFGLDNGSYSEVLEGLSHGDIIYTKLPRKPKRDRD